MKLIALMPARNEERVLPLSLGCLEQFCDHIIVSDHRSIDRTREIAQSFKKVTVIDNTTPQNIAEFGRPALFEAARQFDGNNLLLCLDADELCPPKIFQTLRDFVGNRYAPGMFFSVWWVQLWRSLHVYRADDSIMSNHYRTMMFFDDRRPLQWAKRHLHVGPLPIISDQSQHKRLEGFPLLHLQWVYWERTQFKQAHYRMLEFAEANFADAQGINDVYALSLGDDDARVAPVPPEWLEGIEFPDNLMDVEPDWRRNVVFEMFERYGVERFEPLQIWHIPELHRRFVETMGREPNPLIGKVRVKKKKGLWRRMKGALSFPAPSFLKRLSQR